MNGVFLSKNGFFWYDFYVMEGKTIKVDGQDMTKDQACEYLDTIEPGELREKMQVSRFDVEELLGILIEGYIREARFEFSGRLLGVMEALQGAVEEEEDLWDEGLMGFAA